ncbi:unnamed protein product [Cuscuta campestris]|uniref:Uncharacterized protein n=1 Tax=Cuscuta campestris TaxID=132261 RepID=A0A484L604_9ASTE|nr:unnamed protein product [Cuscuta campestris]
MTNPAGAECTVLPKRSLLVICPGSIKWALTKLGWAVFLLGWIPPFPGAAAEGAAAVVGNRPSRSPSAVQIRRRHVEEPPRSRAVSDRADTVKSDRRRWKTERGRSGRDSPLEWRSEPRRCRLRPSPSSSETHHRRAAVHFAAAVAQFFPAAVSCEEEKRESFEMAEDGKFRIEKFDGTDFSWWKMQIEDLLVQKDLDVVLGDKPEKMSDADWASLDRKAMSVIRLSLTKNVAFNILKEKTAKGIMDALFNMYKSHLQLTKFF